MNELRTLIPYVRPYRRGLAVGLILVVLANAFGILMPKLVGLAVDALERPDIARSDIVLYALAVLGAALLSGAARYGMRELLNGISRRIETDLRDDLFSGSASSSTCCGWMPASTAPHAPVI